MTEEELLKPSREWMAVLDTKIRQMEAETVAKIERYKESDPEYARQLWHEFNLAVEPMRREKDAVAKTIANYYGLQPMPRIFVAALPS